MKILHHFHWKISKGPDADESNNLSELFWGQWVKWLKDWNVKPFFHANR